MEIIRVGSRPSVKGQQDSFTGQPGLIRYSSPTAFGEPQLYWSLSSLGRGRDGTHIRLGRP